MTEDELLARLASLRTAPLASGRRAPHKPLLLLFLLGRLQATGSSAVSYAEAEEPVSVLIDEFGPPARSRRRAAMPFFHLEGDLWDLEGDPGVELTDQAGRLAKARARGRLRPEVEQLLRRPEVLSRAARLLLEDHFTDSYVDPITSAVGLDLDADLEAGLVTRVSVVRHRDPAFREAVLAAYGFTCAMCGFDGRLGRDPAGIEAAHVRWHGHGGPDRVDNGLALCSLHHTLFDLGVLGVTSDDRVRVSPRFVGTSETARTQVHGLDDQPLRNRQPGRPGPDPGNVDWHTAEVFKSVPLVA